MENLFITISVLISLWAMMAVPDDERKEWVSCRKSLWWLVFSGCIINYMLKISLNLVIVAMVVPRSTEPVTSSQCSEKSNLSSNNSISNFTETFVEETIEASILYADRFDWTEYEQGLALGAFYWSYWSTQVPGGLLAQRYGTKLIFGGANFLASIIGLLIPFAIKYHLYGFLILRVLQGAVMGVVCPSMNIMTAKWIPPNERSKFTSSYMGGSVGTAITYPMCAWVIHYWNWEGAFYVTSIIGIIWYCFWTYFMFDSPQEHPRITKEELSYIIANTPASLTNAHERSVPWKAILTSKPMWVTIMAHWGATWGFYTLLAQGPTYFSFIHGWDIHMTGIIAGAPHILLMAFSYGFGVLSDWLLQTQRMTRTGIRKLAMAMCTGVQALFTLGLSLSGCHSGFAVFFMMTGTMMTGALSSGSMANFVDLSPNFSSVLLGICGLIANGAGAISPLIVGVLTNGNQTIEQWKSVFLIAAANLLFGFIVYTLWGTAEEQSWNDSGDYNPEDGEEMRKLNEKPPASELIKNIESMVERIERKEKEAYGQK